MEGKHKVSVIFAGKEIPKSPYNVSVEGTAGDASKVTASGPGLQPDGVMVNRNTYFDIFTKGTNTFLQSSSLPKTLTFSSITYTEMNFSS